MEYGSHTKFLNGWLGNARGGGAEKLIGNADRKVRSVDTPPAREPVGRAGGAVLAAPIQGRVPGGDTIIQDRATDCRATPYEQPITQCHRPTSAGRRNGVDDHQPGQDPSA